MDGWIIETRLNEQPVLDTKNKKETIKRGLGHSPWFQDSAFCPHEKKSNMSIPMPNHPRAFFKAQYKYLLCGSFRN